MTRTQYENRLKAMGATEAEAERIAANSFGGREMDTLPTKITLQQKVDMLALIEYIRAEYAPLHKTDTIQDYKRIWNMA